MKKKIVSLVLALLAVSMLVPFATSASYTESLPENGKTNVLEGQFGTLMSPASDYVIIEDILTDGVICIAGGKPYVNQKWTSSIDKAIELAAADGTYEFNMTDKTVNKYLYYISYSDLNCSVESFSMYFSNETEKYEEGNGCYWQLDAQWAILVSQDGGATWTEAYKSPDYTVVEVDGKNKLAMGGASIESEGGIFTEVNGTDTASGKYYWYRYFSAEFAQRFEGVTDIAYCCIHPRMNADATVGIKDKDNNPVKESSHYYVSRMTELAVYGDAAAADVTTAEETTAEKTDNTTAAKDDETTAAPEIETTTAEKEETKAPSDDTTKAADDQKKGCGSFVGLAFVAALLPAGIMLRKKH